MPLVLRVKPLQVVVLVTRFLWLLLPMLGPGPVMEVQGICSVGFATVVATIQPLSVLASFAISASSMVIMLLSVRLCFVRFVGSLGMSG